MQKECKKCLKIKDIEEFGNVSQNKDGKAIWCKKCHTARSQEANKKRKDTVNKQRRERRKTDPLFRENINKKKMEYYWKDRRSSLYTSIKSSSKRRNLEFAIDIEDIIIPETCPILKVTLDRGNYSPSLDRIDNSKGYIKGNIWVISKKANTMKNAGTIEELLEFCENLPKELHKLNMI